MVHVNTLGTWPKDRVGVEALDNHHLIEFAGECSEEPADEQGCLACYAYILWQERTDEERELARANGHETCPTCGQDV